LNGIDVTATLQLDTGLVELLFCFRPLGFSLSFDHITRRITSTRRNSRITDLGARRNSAHNIW
jgi:uncharacterized membrane protein